MPSMIRCFLAYNDHLYALKPHSKPEEQTITDQNPKGEQFVV